MPRPTNITNLLIISMLGPLSNKIKASFVNPCKNKDLAQNKDVKNLVVLVLEQLLPQYCRDNAKNDKVIDKMHDLLFLLAQKAQNVFNSRVIHTIIDQNWDLKGFYNVLTRILKLIDLKPAVARTNVEKQIEKLCNAQNLQSTSCIRILGSYIRNMKKEILEDDLRNPISTYQTTFKFLKEDLERYREKGISYECFQVLHPWTYDLDAVDFKYLLSNDLKGKIAQQLEGDIDAQVFWLSFFKPQLACAADDFFDAIR